MASEVERIGLFFRRLTLGCLLGVFAIATLAAFDRLSATTTGLAAAALALLLFLFDALADAPQELNSLEQGLNRLLEIKKAAGEDEAVTALDVVKDNPQLMDLITTRSDQMYLLRYRTYLTQQIETQYYKTPLPTLVNELQEVESQLEVLGVEYVAIELPERFRLLVNKFDRQQRLNIYYVVLDALQFLPFRGLIKLYLRFVLR